MTALALILALCALFLWAEYRAGVRDMEARR